MKYFIVLLALLTTTNLFANQKLVNQCQNLQIKNKHLISLQHDEYNICVFHLINSFDSLAIACQRVADGLYYQATEQLCISYYSLKSAEHDHCRHNEFIQPLAHDVNQFRKSLPIGYTCSE